jgi:hypothetical protein
MDLNHKIWNQQQKNLRQMLTNPIEHQQAINLFFRQHAMVHSATVSESGLWSFADEVWTGVTEDDARKIPHGCEHSIAWMFWHIARIEDVTMNLLVAGSIQILNKNGWFDKIGVSYRDTGNAMGQDQVIALSEQINIGELREYRVVVGRRTREIVGQLQPSKLKQKIDPAGLKRIQEEGGVVREAYGLLDYWGGLTHAGLLLMPPTRHNFIHLNEALRMKHKFGK